MAGHSEQDEFRLLREAVARLNLRVEAIEKTNRSSEAEEQPISTATQPDAAL